MRKRWAKVLIPLAGVALFVVLTFSYTYADAEAAASAYPDQPAVTFSEPNEVATVEG